MRTNYLLKSVVYEITDYLGCGTEHQTIIGNKIIETIDKIMELDNNWTINGVIDTLIFDEYDMCVGIKSGLSKQANKLFIDLEYWFYKWYFANQNILEYNDLETGLDSFKNCFNGVYGKYADDYADTEIYKRNFIW